jgi:hypothetical protein
VREVTVFMGMENETLTEEDVRSVQIAVLDSDCSPRVKEVADAILSHFICGRETKWRKVRV